MEFIKYYPDALRMAKNLIRDTKLAEDIVQDIFLRIIKNEIVIDGEKNYKAYLNTAIRNLYFSHCLKKKMPKHKGIKVEVKEAYNIPETISDLRISDSLANAMVSTKSNLTLPLILNVIHDYSYEEIAKILNVPVGTVKSKIHRAKETVKLKLAA